MGKNQTKWSANGSNLPQIDPHTKAKHQILEDYIKRYIVTLCGNNRGNRKKVTFIDGFCGGGMYLDPNNDNALWSGSPIRIIKMVEEALEIVKNDKSKPDYHLDVKFIFIDSNKSHLECLKVQIENSGLGHYLTNGKCEFILGDFKSSIERYIEEIKKRGSSFFFLDPFGWTDVPMETIRKIIALGKSEILYTFMVEDVTRFLPEKDKKLKNAYSSILEANDYYQFINVHSSGSLAKQKYIRDETYRLFRERGKVPFVYSFALLPNRSNPRYYLIHLASSSSAQREMKYTLWKHNTIDFGYQFEYGIYGFGFRTPDYYEQNLSVINIGESNREWCIKKLSNDDLLPKIYECSEGITFEEIHTLTQQKNPATWDDYNEAIVQQRDEQEVQVLREGKITKARRLKPGDVIIKSKYKQLYFFLRKY